MKDRTKWEFAQALIQLTRRKAFKKITVLEICRECDQKPQNFYYHFKDKYDLAGWIYAQDIEEVCESNLNNPWSTALTDGYSNMLKTREFYKKALDDDTTSSLLNYIVDYQISLYHRMLAVRNVTIDEALSFAIVYHACACAIVTKRWLTSADPLPPEKLANYILASMPATLQKPFMLNQD